MPAFDFHFPATSCRGARTAHWQCNTVHDHVWEQNRFLLFLIIMRAKLKFQILNELLLLPNLSNGSSWFFYFRAVDSPLFRCWFTVGLTGLASLNESHWKVKLRSLSLSLSLMKIRMKILQKSERKIIIFRHPFQFWISLVDEDASGFMCPTTTLICRSDHQVTS